jgi:hypothetical protein
LLLRLAGLIIVMCPTLPSRIRARATSSEARRDSARGATKRAAPAGDPQGPSRNNDRPRRNLFSKLFRIVGIRRRDRRQDMDEARHERPVAGQPEARVRQDDDLRQDMDEARHERLVVGQPEARARQHGDGEEYRRATLSIVRTILERAQREISRLRESFRRIPFRVIGMDRRAARFSESEFREV